MSLGGYVAEELIFGDMTTGASNDLQVATALARDMVTKYGMSEKIGPIALEGQGGRAMFGAGIEDKEYAGNVGNEIDTEVAKIMHDGHRKAIKIITDYRHVLDAITTRLIEVETIEREEYEKILIANNIPLKKKKDVQQGVVISE
jgi:cell division protease FtsH